MMRLGGLVVAASLFASSCAAVPDAATVPERLPGVALVSWQTTAIYPFCMECEWTKVAAAADGRVWLETRRWDRDQKDWLEATRMVTVSPDKVAAFSNQLKPVRPAGDLVMDMASCGGPQEFRGEVTVTWTDDQRADRLVYDFGCDRYDIADAIMDAPYLLGIRDLDPWGQTYLP